MRWGNQRHYLWGLVVKGGQSRSGQPHLPTGELQAQGKEELSLCQVILGAKCSLANHLTL